MTTVFRGARVFIDATKFGELYASTKDWSDVARAIDRRDWLIRLGATEKTRARVSSPQCSTNESFRASLC